MKRLLLFLILLLGHAARSKASEGKTQPQRRALISGHAGPKQKGGGNHATQTDGL